MHITSTVKKKNVDFVRIWARQNVIFFYEEALAWESAAETKIKVFKSYLNVMDANTGKSSFPPQFVNLDLPYTIQLKVLRGKTCGSPLCSKHSSKGTT